MDAQTLRRAIHDIFRFNPKDFFVQATLTGFLVSRVARNVPTYLQPFQLVNASDSGGNKVRVVESTLLGAVPDGFSPGDDPPYILDVVDGDIVYAGVTIDTSGEFPGGVTSRFLNCDTVVPDDDLITGEFYMPIGIVTIDGMSGKVTVENYRYGPMNGTAYRLWFSDPKRFNMAWI